MVEVWSDAADNAQAIIEIESWASKHGMLRTNEYRLKAIKLKSGAIVRTAICYRPGPEELQTREDRIRARNEAAERAARLS